MCQTPLTKLSSYAKRIAINYTTAQSEFWLPCSRMSLHVRKLPQKATEEKKRARKRKKKTKQTITHAVTHIRLSEANATTLHERNGVWWLTLSFDEDVPLQTAVPAARVGVDVGIANFITTSTGKQNGSFHGKLARRQKRDRQKRRRKAKLRACL